MSQIVDARMLYEVGRAKGKDYKAEREKEKRERRKELITSALGTMLSKVGSYAVQNYFHGKQYARALKKESNIYNSDLDAVMVKANIVEGSDLMEAVKLERQKQAEGQKLLKKYRNRVDNPKYNEGQRMVNEAKANIMAMSSTLDKMLENGKLQKDEMDAGGGNYDQALKDSNVSEAYKNTLMRSSGAIYQYLGWENGKMIVNMPGETDPNTNEITSYTKINYDDMQFAEAPDTKVSEVASQFMKTQRDMGSNGMTWDMEGNYDQVYADVNTTMAKLPASSYRSWFFGQGNYSLNGVSMSPADAVLMAQFQNKQLNPQLGGVPQLADDPSTPNIDESKLEFKLHTGESVTYQGALDMLKSTNYDDMANRKDGISLLMKQAEDNRRMGYQRYKKEQQAKNNQYNRNPNKQQNRGQYGSKWFYDYEVEQNVVDIDEATDGATIDYNNGRGEFVKKGDQWYKKDNQGETPIEGSIKEQTDFIKREQGYGAWITAEDNEINENSETEEGATEEVATGEPQTVEEKAQYYYYVQMGNKGEVPIHVIKRWDSYYSRFYNYKPEGWNGRGGKEKDVDYYYNQIIKT